MIEVTPPHSKWTRFLHEWGSCIISLVSYLSGCSCIYTYDAAHPVGGKPFTEEDEPNYVGSFYSLTKGMVDNLSPNYKHALTLRLRMPISDDLNGRNFITKITAYQRVIDVPNSVTVLQDMLPVAVAMMERKLTGLFNFTNPGVVSHNDVLEGYKQVIDPTFWYANFSEEEQAKILKAGRCNNNLATDKLQAALPDIPLPHVKDSIRAVFLRMKENLAKDPAGAAAVAAIRAKKGAKPEGVTTF